MERYKRIISTLIFNVAETILIFLVGRILGLEINNIVIVMLCFMISRGCFGKSLHFKTWYRCLVWSLLILLSLFLILKIDLKVSILFTIFSAFIMTGKSNINDMYLWKGKSTKYEDIEEYIKYNSMDSKLIEFEKKLKEQDNLLYLLYKYRFKDNLKFAEISEKLDIDNPRIVEKLDKIAFSLRIYCGI